MTNLDWMDELDMNQFLTGDAKMIYATCGHDVFKVLWSRMQGIPIYPSKTAIQQAMRAYIRKNFNGTNQKDLALKLNVTERFVREVIGTNPRGLKDTIEMFDESAQ